MCARVCMRMYIYVRVSVRVHVDTDEPKTCHTQTDFGHMSFEVLASELLNQISLDVYVQLTCFVLLKQLLTHKLFSDFLLIPFTGENKTIQDMEEERKAKEFVPVRLG